MNKPSCTQHKKDVAGIVDMKELAGLIGDLHYETLFNFLEELSNKLYLDAAQDAANGRKQLADQLEEAASDILFSSINIEQAWKISKPFMQ